MPKHYIPGTCFRTETLDLPMIIPTIVPVVVPTFFFPIVIPVILPRVVPFSLAVGAFSSTRSSGEERWRPVAIEILPSNGHETLRYAPTTDE